MGFYLDPGPRREPEHTAQHALAARLADATGGRLEVEFDGSMYFADDETASGHLFSCRLEFDEGNCTVDDRQGPVGKLLAEELRKQAKLLRRLARKLERVEGGAA